MFSQLLNMLIILYSKSDIVNCIDYFIDTYFYIVTVIAVHTLILFFNWLANNSE